MKKLLTILLLTSLSAVACDDKPIEVSNEFIYSHPMVQRDFLPIVGGTLNGKKAYFLLDTGASVSILDLKSSTEYDVRIGGVEKTGIGGYGGVTSDVNELYNIDLRFGSLKLDGEYSGKDIGYLITAIQRNTGLKIVGIVGNNNIAGKNLILDFETNTILKRK